LRTLGTCRSRWSRGALGSRRTLPPRRTLGPGWTLWTGAPLGALGPLGASGSLRTLGALRTGGPGTALQTLRALRACGPLSTGAIEDIDDEVAVPILRCWIRHAVSVQVPTIDPVRPRGPSRTLGSRRPRCARLSRDASRPRDDERSDERDDREHDRDRAQCTPHTS